MDTCCCPVDDCVHSVTSAHVDLRIDNNGTWQDAFQFGEPDDTTWTLEGQHFEMDIQLTYYGAALLSLSTVDGRIITDDLVQRVIHFNVDPQDIQDALDPGTYVYDLVMINGNPPPGIRVPLMHGTIQVAQGVTGGL